MVLPPTGPIELWALDFSADSNYFYYLTEDVTNRILNDFVAVANHNMDSAPATLYVWERALV